MKSEISSYIKSHQDRFLEDLKAVLRIESVSTQPESRPKILECADWEVQTLKRVGLENTQLIPTPTYPLVYGDWLHAPGKPTLLIYGHYDVQPADPIDQWKTPPFEPTVKDGNIYGRGTSDNKAQHMAHVFAIETLLQTMGKLPINIKVILEGEEESGSAGLAHFLKTPQAKMVSCDAMIISDSPWLDNEHPCIEYALRGLVYFELKVKGPSHDLHSGLCGGMIRNPLQVLSWILAKLKDENEHILVPHVYDDVLPIGRAEKTEVEQIPFDEKACEKECGVKKLVSEKDFSALEGNWFRPTLEINGMWGGYQAAGTKTIIPSEAGAKVSMRLVANQNPTKIREHFVKYVESLCPADVTLEVKSYHGGPPVYIDPNHPFLKKAAKAYGEAYGKPAFFKRDGASIPIVANFQEILQVPIILAGIGLPDDSLHSPNEKMSLRNFYDGIFANALTYMALGE